MTDVNTSLKIVDLLARVDDTFSLCVNKCIVGVYILYDEEKVVYVGQTTNFFSRMASHIASERTFENLLFLPCEEHELNGLEASLIALFRSIPENNLKSDSANLQNKRSPIIDDESIDKILTKLGLAQFKSSFSYPNIEPATPIRLSGEATSFSSRLMTEKEAASYLGISPITLKMQRHYGKRDRHLPVVPYIKLGKSVRYDYYDLEAFIEASRVST